MSGYAYYPFLILFIFILPLLLTISFLRILYLYKCLKKTNSLLTKELDTLPLHKNKIRTLTLQNQLLQPFGNASIKETMEVLDSPLEEGEEILCVLLQRQSTSPEQFLLLKKDMEAYLLEILCFSEDFYTFILKGHMLNIRQIQSLMENYDITCFMGKAVSSHSTFYEAYISAYNVMIEYIPKMDEGYQCYTYEEYSYEIEVLPYPVLLEGELIKELKNQNTEKCNELIKDYFNTIDTDCYSVMYHSFYQLFIMLRRIEEKMKLDLSSPLPDLLLYKQTNKKLTKEAMLSFLYKRIEEAILVLSTQLTNYDGKEKIADKILKFLSENADNPNLNADMIADNLGLSKNYLRTVCKEVTNRSLSLHLQTVKIKQVCKLLIETDYTVAEISEQLDFFSNNYFFTFFKKHTGMTPLQYRLIHKEKEKGS